MRYGHLLAAMAAIGLLGNPRPDDIRYLSTLDNPPSPLPTGIAYGPSGHTQGSHRDVEHERHLSRLARKARRQTRLHGHSAAGHRALQRTSNTLRGGYAIA